MKMVNIDIQSKNTEEKVLDLQARVQLSEVFIDLVYSLKEDFVLNLNKGDGSLSTINSEIITENDIGYLEKIIEYLKLIMDKTGRLKILVVEQEVYKKIQEDKNKERISIGNWFNKTFKKEKK